MAFDKNKSFFVAIDRDWPESRPGYIVAIYWEDWNSGHPVVEGWRGIKMESEDFPKKRLEPYACQHLLTDIGGYWECFSGTIIGRPTLGTDKLPWCKGSGMAGLRIRNWPRWDRCPVCDEVFVKSGRMRIPLHREGVGDAR